MNRVVVIGCAGSGKSTLCRRLSGITGLPVVERDRLLSPDPAQFRAAVLAATEGATWIFDGHPHLAGDIVFPAVDAVVFRDYPKGAVMLRVLRRHLRVEPRRETRGVHRPQGIAGLRHREHPVRLAWDSHSHRHLEGLDLKSRMDPSVSFVHLYRPAEANRWLDKLRHS